MTGHVEIVHTPHLADDHGVLGPNPQPWHVRIVGGNGEIILTGEPLATLDDAETAVLAVARIFGATEPSVHHSMDDEHRGVVLGGRRAAADGRASSLPLNSRIAEDLRGGATLDDLAARYGVSASRLRTRLNDAGWESTGQPAKHPTTAAAADVFLHWPSWVDRALCAEVDPEVFYPEQGGSSLDAKRVCLACEVRLDCLDYALANSEAHGIWGGISERDRRKIKRQQRRTA